MGCAGPVKVKADAFFYDLDGTFFLPNSGLAIQNFDALRSAKARDVICCVATGRNPTSVRIALTNAEPDDQKLVLDTPAIYCNGAIIYGKNGECLSKTFLTSEQAKNIIALVKKRGMSDRLSGYTETAIEALVISDHTLFTHHEYKEQRPVKVEAMDGPYHKMVIRCPDEETLASIRHEISNQIDSKLVLNDAHHLLLEINPNATSKGQAIQQLSQHLLFDMEHTAAVGDGYNDISMFRVVRYGFAMGNAVPALKALAYRVVGTNVELGCAEAMSAVWPS